MGSLGALLGSLGDLFDFLRVLLGSLGLSWGSLGALLGFSWGSIGLVFHFALLQVLFVTSFELFLDSLAFLSSRWVPDALRGQGASANRQPTLVDVVLLQALVRC